MIVRTYFWHERVVSPRHWRLRRLLHLNPQHYFLHGNAGDVFGRHIVEHVYAARAHNDPARGQRLLAIGSTAHRMRNGDILCGIGVKDVPVPGADRVRVSIRGLRGPLSRDALKRAGHDVSQVRFLLDPGLMLRFMIDRERAVPAARGVVFIPHYRERTRYRGRLPRGIRLVDVDADPLAVGREILAAELVYSSSLHGIVFAHALERPCVWVAPQTAEPLFKYHDYFTALDMPVPRPLTHIDAADFLAAPSSPPTLRYSPASFDFPTFEALVAAGIAEPADG